MLFLDSHSCSCFSVNPVRLAVLGPSEGLRSRWEVPGGQGGPPEEPLPGVAALCDHLTACHDV